MLASHHGWRGRHEDDHRRYADDDDEDERDGRGISGQPRVSDPNAPIPNNGLFNGKARPKVDVR